jgi:hypothetical protein
MLTVDPTKRITIDDVFEHLWMTGMARIMGQPVDPDLIEKIQKNKTLSEASAKPATKKKSANITTSKSASKKNVTEVEEENDEDENSETEETKNGGDKPDGFSSRKRPRRF